MPNNPSQVLSNAKRIHMIGIGGAGMCPLAEILHSRGYVLSGSDNNQTDTLERVRSLGVRVTLGHSPENIGDAQAVVYSAAIMKDNPELRAAFDSGLPVLERSELLGAVTRQYGNVISVCGTHGKTTVSSMITHILIKSGLEPSAVIGGKLPLINANGLAGASDTLVCEACEYVDTFLKLSTDKTVVLNIDADHLEYFKTVDNLILSFRKFADMTTDLLIINGEDARTLRAVGGLDKRVITFGFGEDNDYYTGNIQKLAGTQTRFDLYHKGELLCGITLSIPGRHNILNAVAACAASLDEGVSPAQLSAALESFTGAGRRFEVLGNPRGITVADDYAHHPAELEVTLKTAMEMGFNRVIAIFQPFTFSRTQMLLDEFAQALSIPDICILTPIMGSREVNTYGIRTQDLGEKIPGAVWFDTFEQVAEHAVKKAQPGDLIITMGCGDVYKVAKIILNNFQ